MNKAANWKPDFPEMNDRKVKMCSDELQTFAVSREVGVIVTESVEKQSPACFWIDEQNVYLRINWSTWYKVSTDSPETISTICKRHTAKLTQVIDNCSKDCFIPVFHIDRLPEELFDGVFDKDGDDEDPEPDEAGENAPDPKSIAWVRLAADLVDRMGDVVCEYKKGQGEFVLIRGRRCLLLVSFFAPLEVQWLADEESFNGEPPLWFSEVTQLQSPLYAVEQAAQYLKNEFAIDATPVVILDDRIDIINRDDILDIWRKTGVLVCYCRREEDGIPVFDPELCAVHGEAPDDRTVAAAKEALDAFVPMSPEDWEKLLQEDGDEDISELMDDEAGRRYCLGKYHSDELHCDFQLVYDFHRLLLLPDGSSNARPTADMLAEIGKRISKAGAYSDFGFTDRERPDDPDDVRANVEAADRLFKRSGEWWETAPYDTEHDERLKDWLVKIEKFWRRGNPIALRDAGLASVPIWSLVFESEPAALLFQYPDEEKWGEHSKGMLDDYIREFALATHYNQELTIFCVVILESTSAEELRQLNTGSPPGMFFVSPESLNETVMKIFTEDIFTGSGEAD